MTSAKMQYFCVGAPAGQKEEFSRHPYLLVKAVAADVYKRKPRKNVSEVRRSVVSFLRERKGTKIRVGKAELSLKTPAFELQKHIQIGAKPFLFATIFYARNAEPLVKYRLTT